MQLDVAGIPRIDIRISSSVDKATSASDAIESTGTFDALQQVFCSQLLLDASDWVALVEK